MSANIFLKVLKNVEALVFRELVITSAFTHVFYTCFFESTAKGQLYNNSEEIFQADETPPRTEKAHSSPQNKM
jgi:hypothetical protein